MLLRTPGQAPSTSQLVIKAAGKRCRQTTQFSYLGGLVDAFDIIQETKRRVRLAWACYSRLKRGLYDMEAAPIVLKVRILNAEVMETSPYGCVTWTLGKEYFAELRTVHHMFLLRIIGFQRRQRTDRLMSYVKALEKAQCESVETTIGKRRLLFVGPYSGRTMSD